MSSVSHFGIMEFQYTTKWLKSTLRALWGPSPEVLVRGKLVSEFRQAANLQQPLLKTRNAHCSHSTYSRGKVCGKRQVLKHGLNTCVLEKGKCPTARNPPWEYPRAGVTYSYTSSKASAGAELTFHTSHSALPLWLSLWVLLGLFLCLVLTETKSLDKSVRSQNPRVIAGSYHWNCAYCHLQYSTASHRFTGCLFRLCSFYQSWLNLASFYLLSMSPLTEYIIY